MITLDPICLFVSVSRRSVTANCQVLYWDVQNVVLDRRGPRALVKLCDFGFSVRNEADARAPVLCSRAVGTPDYMVRSLHLHRASFLSDGLWCRG